MANDITPDLKHLRLLLDRAAGAVGIIARHPRQFAGIWRFFFLMWVKRVRALEWARREASTMRGKLGI